MTKLIDSLVVCVAVVTLLVGAADAQPPSPPGPTPPPPQQGGFLTQPVITAAQATAAASAAITKLTLGKLYTKQGAQEVLLEAPLQLDASIVGRVRLNPSNGEILTKGQRGMAQQVSVTPEEAGKALLAILPKIQVGGGAWWGREGNWKVPLVYQGAIISELEVNSRDAAIMPDRGAGEGKAEKEKEGKAGKKKEFRSKAIELLKKTGGSRK